MESNFHQVMQYDGTRTAIFLAKSEIIKKEFQCFCENKSVEQIISKEEFVSAYMHPDYHNDMMVYCICKNIHMKKYYYLWVTV